MYNELKYRGCMRYAFVFTTIVVIWIAIVLMAELVKRDVAFLEYSALLLTVVLFWIGFRSK